MAYAIVEAFNSIQGEGPYAGHSATFLRFFGCNKECTWCDTKYARKGEAPRSFGSPKKLTEWLRHLTRDHAIGHRLVLTGGEPMLQVDYDLIHELSRMGLPIDVETNGCAELDLLFDQRVVARIDALVISPKSPEDFNGWKRRGSGMFDYMHTYLKIVPTPEWTKDWTDWEAILEAGRNMTGPRRFIQPLATGDEVADLAMGQDCAAFVNEHADWRLSIQMHKILKLK